MNLTDAYAEFLLAHDYQPATLTYYRERLGRFIRWCEAQNVTTVAGLTTGLVRRYMDERKNQTSEATGRPLDSYTLHSTARGILA